MSAIKTILEILVGIGFLALIFIEYIPHLIVHPDDPDTKAFLFGVLMIIIFIIIYANF